MQVHLREWISTVYCDGSYSHLAVSRERERERKREPEHRLCTCENNQKIQIYILSGQQK
jgi:hypothetical protein